MQNRNIYESQTRNFLFSLNHQGKLMSFKNDRKFANLFLANLNSVILEKLTCANSTKKAVNPELIIRSYDNIALMIP